MKLWGCFLPGKIRRRIKRARGETSLHRGGFAPHKRCGPGLARDLIYPEQLHLGPHPCPPPTALFKLRLWHPGLFGGLCDGLHPEPCPPAWLVLQVAASSALTWRNPRATSVSWMDPSRSLVLIPGPSPAVPGAVSYRSGPPKGTSCEQYLKKSYLCSNTCGVTV